MHSTLLGSREERGRVASQTRHEGASFAQRALCTSSVAGDRVTLPLPTAAVRARRAAKCFEKHGEATCPSALSILPLARTFLPVLTCGPLALHGKRPGLAGVRAAGRRRQVVSPFVAGRVHAWSLRGRPRF